MSVQGTEQTSHEQCMAYKREDNICVRFMNFVLIYTYMLFFIWMSFMILIWYLLKSAFYCVFNSFFLIWTLKYIKKKNNTKLCFIVCSMDFFLRVIFLLNICLYTQTRSLKIILWNIITLTWVIKCYFINVENVMKVFSGF